MIPAEGTAALVQGTAVSVDGHAALIIGPSGSGKSALALQMIGLGAALIADDLVDLQREGDQVVARCPNPDLLGVIEARGVGLLRAPVAADGLPLHMIVTLSSADLTRLPPECQIHVLGCVITLVSGTVAPHFPVALMLHLRHGRYA